MAKMTKIQLIEALALVSHDASLSDLEAMTNKELGALLQSSPKKDLPVLTAEDEQDQAFVDSLKPVVESTPVLTLPVGYSVMKESDSAFYVVMPNGKESEYTHETYEQALQEAIADAIANPTQIVTKKRGADQKPSVDKKVSAKDKAFDLFKNNASLKSPDLLDLVCKELDMNRKVASSYLCYYRKEYNIVATRGLTKEDKLKAFINDQFSCDLSEGQMIAILHTINED